MGLSAAATLARPAGSQRFAWSERDYLLYALAIGIGGNASDAALPFVFERDLRVVPTFPTVLAWLLEPTFASLGASPDHALHAGQKIEIHHALTGPTVVLAEGGVVAVRDMGAARGALIVMRHELTEEGAGRRLATLTTSGFARDCGGCGSGGETIAALHTLPVRPPDRTVSYAVRADAALLYRLTGDRNPLHAELAAARRAGFERPLLHGLCTFGMAMRAVLELVVAWQAGRIVSHEARFSAPVYPGDTLEIALWQDGATVSFEASVPHRRTVVLRGGKTQLS